MKSVSIKDVDISNGFWYDRQSTMRRFLHQNFGSYTFIHIQIRDKQMHSAMILIVPPIVYFAIRFCANFSLFIQILIKAIGKDAYPLLRDVILNDPKIYNEEQVRNEMFLNLDYYPTELSGHDSEYNAWFHKRPDLLEKYCTHGTNWNPGEYAFSLNMRLKRDAGGGWKDEMQKWLDADKVDIARGHEYAAYIFNAIFGDNTMFDLNVNVRNFGLIDNLPEGSCVEVPVLASKSGIRPMHVGPLPTQVAIVTATNSQCEKLAVEGAITDDPRKVFHAICNDPLTSAVLSLDEIKSMVNELFLVNKDRLPNFKHFN